MVERVSCPRGAPPPVGRSVDHFLLLAAIQVSLKFAETGFRNTYYTCCNVGAGGGAGLGCFLSISIVAIASGAPVAHDPLPGGLANARIAPRTVRDPLKFQRSSTPRAFGRLFFDMWAV